MSAPPPPPPPTFCAPSAGNNGRGMLLQSIRAGKSLKKTVTVDKSAPVIGGRIKDDSLSSVGAPPRGNTMTSGGNIGSVAAPNLGGLFSGGMPKLKATGLRSNIVEKDTGNVAVSAVSSPAPSVKRGPPPVPPPATQKPQVIGQLVASSTEPVVSKGFGKPMLAPKPPPPPPVGAGSQKPSPPPKKLNLLGGPSVSRAQSMRLPRSPPVLTPAAPSSLHQSQDCLNEMTQHQHRPIINRALRPPIARPPSPPTSKTFPRDISHQTQRVAPPPPSRLAVTAPSMPPPPPPPPYRSTSMHQRLAPPPPPTPPTRIASAGGASSVVRNGSTTTGMTTMATTTTTMMTTGTTMMMTTTTSSTTIPPTMMMMSVDLEVRFADKFHSIMNFPNPSPFRGFPKVYNSKNAAKQQAPAPPLQSTSAPGTMLRLNASSGGKQWQHNAASSAC